MKIKGILWATATVVILINLAQFFIVGLLSPPESAAAAETPAEMAQAVITLPQAAQEKAGIVVAPVSETFHTKELRAYGMVLPVQALAELKQGYARALARVENALAQLKVSQKEYARQKALFAQDQNISLKALQAAEGAWRVDQSNHLAAREELQGLKGAAQQQWGEVVASWVFTGSPIFSRLVARQDFLVQVTLPAGTEVSPTPRHITLQPPTGASLSARMISQAPQTDPHLQGLSFFSLVSGKPGKLQTRMNVVALIPAGAEVKGFVIPAAAVVWRQGKAIIYVQKEPDRFTAQPVSTETLVQEGYFVTAGLKSGDRLVVQGAQVLLSEESGHPGGQDED